MGKDLLYHRLFIDETDDSHLTGAFGADLRIDFPDKPGFRTFLMCLKEMPFGCTHATASAVFALAYSS